MGDVILVCSEKRDIGKTVLSIKTGIELSKRGKHVLLVDLSSGNKKISEYLKVNEDIIYDIKDVLDGTCSIEQSVIDVKENLSILPYPRILNKLGPIKRESFAHLIADTKRDYDMTIVDIDSIASCYYIDFENIDSAIIVNNNDFSAVKEINIEFDIAEKFGLKQTILVINKYNKKDGNKGIMLRLNEMKKMIGKDTLGIIEDNIKYIDADYDFLFDNEINTFNKTIDCIVNKIY